MATIRASCPDCGDVELTTREVSVRVCASDQRGAYIFRCPSCRMAVTKGAEPRIVDLLVSSGVDLEVFEQRVGEPLNHDDLLEFHELMEGDDWFEQLTSGIEPS
jgi:uncharacterized Zn finger protein